MSISYSPPVAPPTSAAPRPHLTPNERHFDTSHLEENLNSRIARSSVVTISSQAAKFGLRIGSVAILSRLLAPADFGLITMVTVVIGFLEIFKDSGLSMATVQREKISHAQISTLFWINVGLAAAVMVIQAALAPAIAWFYGDSRLIPITLVLSTLVLISGLTIQHQALLRRNMRFGSLAIIEIASIAIGILTGAVMAVSGYRYWALVGMTAATTIGTALLTFALCRWIPGLPRRRTGVRPMLRFGGGLAGARLFGYLTTRGDNFIIGVMHGSEALGIYGRAYSMFLAPFQQFLEPVSSVVIPALSRAVSNPQRFRNIFLEKSYFLVFFATLATGFSFAATPELVRLLLGPSWESAVIVVRCLAIGGVISATNIAGPWVGAPHGWSDRSLKVAMVAGPTYTLAFLIGSQFGIVGVACAFSITCALLRYPMAKYILRGSPITPRDFILPLIRIGAGAAIAAVAAIYAGSLFQGISLISMLALKGFVFFAVFSVFLVLRLIKLPTVTRIG